MKITNEVKKFLGKKESCFKTNMAGIDTIKSVNLNHERSIYLGELKSGRTLFKVKISRKYYFVMIEKNCFNMYLYIYNDTPKYRLDTLGYLVFRNDVVNFLTKEMILNASEIEKAIALLHGLNIRIKGE